MAVVNNPVYPSGNSPNAPNYVENAAPVIVLDGNTGGVVNFSGKASQEFIFADAPSMDAFGRLRVSNPYIRFDAQLTYDLQPILYEQLISGAGASISHDGVNRVGQIDFSNTPSGGYAYFQSYEWSHYLAGNSHQAFVTFNFKGHTAGVTKFAGYGAKGTNGIFLISDGVNLAWRLESDTLNGDQEVKQSDWSYDTFDGNGPSGLTLDVDTIQIIVIDIQALYAGRVRVGFDINGVFYLAHEFNHANVAEVPYIQIASLPISCGMLANATVTSSMILICASVRSEGAPLEDEGYNATAEGVVTAGSNTRTHILTVRAKETFGGFENRVHFVLENIDIIVTGNTSVKWELVIGQNLTNPSYTDVNTTYSAFEYVSAATLSGNPGMVIGGGYVSATGSQKSSFSRQFSHRYPITLNAAGNNYSLGELTLLVTGLGATSATRAILNWVEVR